MKYPQNSFQLRGVFRTLLLAVLPTLTLVTARADELFSRALITRRAHGINYTLESTDARINIEPNETVHVDLHLAVNRGIARVTAPNGGAFNRAAKTIEVDLAKNGATVGFDFSAGPNPGRYTLEITHGNATRTFEFWAGQEPPQGKPGPNLTFNGDR
jgi:hypothetical protein